MPPPMMATVVFVTNLHLNRGRGRAENPSRMGRSPPATSIPWTGQEQPVRNRAREVVVTGTGVCCHMGDDWPAIEAALREGRPRRRSRAGLRPSSTGSQCEVIGLYPGDLLARTARDRQEPGALHGPGRAARAARRPAGARRGAAIARATMAVVVGSGTGDVDTHREIAARLARTEGLAPRVADRDPAPHGLDRARQPRDRARRDRPVLHRHRGLRGRRLQPAPRGPAHRERPRGRGDRRRRRRRRHPLPRRLRRHARVHHGGQRPARARLAPVRGRPRRLRLLGGRGGRGARDARSAAEARGAAILGVLRGYGMSSDGTGSMVAPSPEGAELAMRRALDHAGVGPEDDRLRQHPRRRRRPLGDVSEVRAMRQGARGAPRRLLLDQGLHRPPRLRRRRRSRRSSRWPCSAGAGSLRA